MVRGNARELGMRKTGEFHKMESSKKNVTSDPLAAIQVHPPQWTKKSKKGKKNNAGITAEEIYAVSRY